MELERQMETMNQQHNLKMQQMQEECERERAAEREAWNNEKMQFEKDIEYLEGYIEDANSREDDLQEQLAAKDEAIKRVAASFGIGAMLVTHVEKLPSLDQLHEAVELGFAERRSWLDLPPQQCPGLSTQKYINTSLTVLKNVIAQRECMEGQAGGAGESAGRGLRAAPAEGHAAPAPPSPVPPELEQPEGGQLVEQLQEELRQTAQAKQRQDEELLRLQQANEQLEAELLRVEKGKGVLAQLDEEEEQRFKLAAVWPHAGWAAGAAGAAGAAESDDEQSVELRVLRVPRGAGASSGSGGAPQVSAGAGAAGGSSGSGTTGGCVAAGGSGGEAATTDDMRELADLLAQFPPDTRFSLSAGPDEELTIGMQLELDGLGGAPTTQQALILALKQALKLQNIDTIEFKVDGKPFPLSQFPKKCKAAINDLKTLEDMCKAAAEVVIPLVLTTEEVRQLAVKTGSVTGPKAELNEKVASLLQIDRRTCVLWYGKKSNNTTAWQKFIHGARDAAGTLLMQQQRGSGQGQMNEKK